MCWVKVLAWYIVCVFLGPVYSFTKQIPRDDVPFFSEFYRMISNTMYTWIFQCCKICWGQTFYTGDIWNLLSAMCFFFFRQTHWFRKRKHPWCRLSWKHFWGYHLTHPWLKVWGWLLLWLGHSTMKLSLPISGADCLHDPGESVTRTRDLRGIRADR